jgi:hypothetical protein
VSVHNERVKLFATYMNVAAGSCLALGVIAPLAAVLFIVVPFGIGVSAALSKIGAGAAVWLVASVLLHWIAQLALGSLRDE